MSEELLQKMISLVDEEDGVHQKKAKRGRRDQENARARDKHTFQRLIRAAEKGEVNFVGEDSFLVERGRKTTPADERDKSLVKKGYSLVEQARRNKPKDLLKRNIKYMKYTEKRQLDNKKAEKILKFHMRDGKFKRDQLRKIAESVTGLREPKKNKKRGEGKSVFSDEDFARVSRASRPIQDANGVFL